MTSSPASANDWRENRCRRATAGDDMRIVHSLPHGHVAAVLGIARKIGLDRLLASTPVRESQLVIAMIVSRIIAPGSKLANLAGLARETAQHTLANELHLCDIQTAETYVALDWLLERQNRIENKLANSSVRQAVARTVGRVCAVKLV